MSDIINRFRQVSDSLFSERMAKEKVMATSEYSELTDQMAVLAEQRDALLPDCPSEVLFNSLKGEILTDVKAGTITEADGITIKFREKKEVNQNKVMEAIGGDFGIFQELASITQAKLKDFAKTQGGLKKSLMACVEVVSREPVDITLIK